MDTHARFLIAQQIYHAKNYKQALNLYSELESEGFKHYEMFIELGHIYFHHKAFSQAFQYYLKAHETDVKNVYPIMRMLKCHDQLNLPIEMFMEDYFDLLLECPSFSEKELKKIKLIYQKQDKEEKFTQVELKACTHAQLLEAKKAQFDNLEELEKQIEHARSIYLSNVRHAPYLHRYVELLELGQRSEDIHDVLKHAYHNIHHFEVDYLRARHLAKTDRFEDARGVMTEMESRLKKQEREKKNVKFQEYQKLAELFHLIGDESRHDHYQKMKLKSQNAYKTKSKKRG